MKDLGRNGLDDDPEFKYNDLSSHKNSIGHFGSLHFAQWSENMSSLSMRLKLNYQA